MVRPSRSLRHNAILRVLLAGFALLFASLCQSKTVHAGTHAPGLPHVNADLDAAVCTHDGASAVGPRPVHPVSDALIEAVKGCLESPLARCFDCDAAPEYAQLAGDTGSESAQLASDSTPETPRHLPPATLEAVTPTQLALEPRCAPCLIELPVIAAMFGSARTGRIERPPQH
ncbi:MAG: hypothetical protein EXR75_09420 [Myxococcales bacterium]|nr:hypothetical protein [Myxococcales bacterium]